MSETELQPEVMVYYINNKTGQTYLEIRGRIFEMEICADVTDEALYLELEPITVYDPASVDEEPGTLRVVSIGQ